jgi:hypothetical protein
MSKQIVIFDVDPFSGLSGKRRFVRDCLPEVSDLDKRNDAINDERKHLNFFPK